MVILMISQQSDWKKYFHVGLSEILHATFLGSHYKQSIISKHMHLLRLKLYDFQWNVLAFLPWVPLNCSVWKSSTNVAEVCK